MASSNNPWWSLQDLKSARFCGNKQRLLPVLSWWISKQTPLKLAKTCQKVKNTVEILFLSSCFSFEKKNSEKFRSNTRHPAIVRRVRRCPVGNSGLLVFQVTSENFKVSLHHCATKPLMKRFRAMGTNVSTSTYCIIFFGKFWAPWKCLASSCRF